MSQTKTATALGYVDGGMDVRQAARKADVSESAVHSALRRRSAKEDGTCLNCGQEINAVSKERLRIIDALQDTIDEAGDNVDRVKILQSVINFIKSS